MKPYKQRREFIRTWLRSQTSSRPDCNVLDSDFVDAYVEATGARVKLMMYGANKCPQLGRDLTRMHREMYLKRTPSGLEGMAGMGFPRWVYTYWLNPRMDAA